MSEEEKNILYDFVNNEETEYCYDWNSLDHKTILPLIDKSLKEIERLHSIIKEVRELCEHKIEMLELQKKNIMEILTPENGYLAHDIEKEIIKYKVILEILDKENNNG